MTTYAMGGCLRQGHRGPATHGGNGKSEAEVPRCIQRPRLNFQPISEAQLVYPKAGAYMVIVNALQAFALLS
jgi:hypothetical protein